MRQVRGRLCFAFQETRNHRVECQTPRGFAEVVGGRKGFKLPVVPSSLSSSVCSPFSLLQHFGAGDILPWLGGESLIEVGDRFLFVNH